MRRNPMDEPKPGPGRPELKITAAMRKRVAIGAAAGMSHEALAAALGMSRNSLEKHFEAELSVGAAERRLEVVLALHAAAKKGSVAAAKAFLAAPAPRAPRADEPVKTDVEAAADAGLARPLEGKKAQANADAKTAAVGTAWESLLQPGGQVQ